MSEQHIPGVEQINVIAKRLMDEAVDEAIAEGADQFRAGKTSGIIAMKVAVKELVAKIYEFDGPFQQRVHPWMMQCFGHMIAGDREERNHRFLEEALELVQSTGCTASEAHQLVDYVYGRPVGEPAQEIGGVMVTLAALCLANALDMHQCGEAELARIWTKVEQIRAKQAAKPKFSPLPAAPTQHTSPTTTETPQ